MNNERVVDKIEALYYEIEKRIKLISLDSLPNIEADDRTTVPTNTSCVYFLTHQEHGLLYIGKALNLKYRLSYHQHIKRAVEIGDARISWLEVPKALLTFAKTY